MAVLNLTESVKEKLDLIILRLISLDSRMEELNETVKDLQEKVSSLELEVVGVKDKQSTLVKNIPRMEENARFVDEQIKEPQGSMDGKKMDISECREQILYLEAYSHQENLKFDGIPEVAVTSSHQDGSTRREDTKNLLVNFMGGSPGN